MSILFDEFADKAINGIGDSDSHLVLFQALALSLKAKNVLELGVREGTSTLPLLSAVKMTGGFLDSVDITPTSFKAPDEFKPYWKFHCSDAISYLKTLNKKLDLVFIDDWHDGNHVYNEIMLIEPWITNSSIILLHDTMHSGSHPNYRLDPPDYDTKGIHFGNGGPYGALLKLNKNEWEWSTIPSCHGLTILRKIK